MSFVEFMIDNRAEVLRLTLEHLLLVGLSTGIASAVGIPTGILLSRVPSARGPVLGTANVFQAIPSLALLGFLLALPLVGGIGARPAIVALVVYALMPIIKNTYTGIMGVDSSVRDAARGIGMTDGQILRMVEIPLAMPVILTGVRIATVIGVGVATIAAAIGAGGLGEYIFRGVAMVNHDVILAGAVPAALLALLADGGLHLVERRLDRRGA
jgi:osmoprotectant transport system permease protein